MSTEKSDPAGWDGESRFCNSWQNMPSPPYADTFEKKRVGEIIKRERVCVCGWWGGQEDGKYKSEIKVLMI